MPVQSLYELARQRLIKNIDLVRDIGDLPYSFLGPPVLRFIQNPDQLAELETKCPQILGETGEIWLRFIKRDIPDWSKKPHEPKDPNNWGKVYRKLKRDAEIEKHADEVALKQKMKALQNDRAQNKTMIVDSRMAYGAGASRVFTGRTSTPWGVPSGAPVKTGKVAFDKLKRGMFDRGRERPKASHIPAHILAQRKTTVRQAPARMVRMEETKAPREQAAPVAKKPEQQPSASASAAQARIKQRPAPPTRTSLPAGQQFNAPKPVASTGPSGVAPPPKRKREPYSMFQPKKRKML
ncbi:Elongin-A domain containing protein [Pyrenophora tritici-repentis]|uniref:Elongin-A domain containing protein n=2 Tax=Pyrenophora tritici-repentis TaxID=45151 RepID=A0A2W1FIX2_9PLEO|nr:uncharacterized protein PTRG_02155 [Pyrenophora tritici-repentis Pt-1C-BFP]KAA8626883.1 Elongin-A domain-containing protein [Pyrenophora tritici-repentis]EDU41593.1 conserved hypothetical protein [Pyrenophora tritici-repentis Pt-1C-BFP]KAF7455320.1 Elongin-A domain containing protein [Pyrenophora tritici-repentis]KAF7578503.1 Elongin-A domain containing protein [Pyrenophora tritici-repentis]KAG9389067.1 Elongin-A domain containing protein [Pyrenophora tritici-repentis]